MFPLFKPPGLWYFIMAALGNEYIIQYDILEMHLLMNESEGSSFPLHVLLYDIPHVPIYFEKLYGLLTGFVTLQTVAAGTSCTVCPTGKCHLGLD